MTIDTDVKVVYGSQKAPERRCYGVVPAGSDTGVAATSSSSHQTAGASLLTLPGKVRDG